MKQVFAAVIVAVLALGVASAQDYYYGAEPAPSMYAAQAGMPQPQPQPQPQAWMYAPQQQPQAMPYAMPPAAFVEQRQQAQQQAYAPFPQEAEEEAAEVEGAAAQAEAENEADESDEELEHEIEAEAEEEGEAEAENEAESDEEVDEAEAARFMQEARGGQFKKHVKNYLKKAKAKGKRALKAAKAFLKKIAGGGKKKKKKGAKIRTVGGKKKKHPRKKHGKNAWFKPTVGKKKNKLKRTPNAKTPKSAGKPLPPMPAPLAKKHKINCKKSPHLCIEAETPAAGEEPGDHSPKAVFKKKMEVIKKALTANNRNIAIESKWIDQVDAIMKQYKLKVKKVKEHIADERKAIKELLRQRRITLNEKKQKELEMKLKIATTELRALTDALGQVQKKERELGAGKSTLGSKIKLLAADLKKLRTKHAADSAQSIVRH